MCFSSLRLGACAGAESQGDTSSGRRLSSPGLLPKSQTARYFPWPQLVLLREPPTRGSPGADRLDSCAPGAASSTPSASFRRAVTPCDSPLPLGHSMSNKHVVSSRACRSLAIPLSYRRAEKREGCLQAQLLRALHPTLVAGASGGSGRAHGSGCHA